MRIADFGLAKMLVQDEAGLTHSCQVMGTYECMAPEQIHHPLGVDHRADVYSLGVLLYEMLTGDLPRGRFAPPSEKVPLDERLDDVVAKALQEEREARYQSVGELVDFLPNLLRVLWSTGITQPTSLGTVWSFLSFGLVSDQPTSKSSSNFAPGMDSIVGLGFALLYFAPLL